MMRLLFLNSYYPPDIGGGAEIVLKAQVDGLRSKGHAVAVACTSSTSGTVREAVNDVPVYRAGIANSYWPLDGVSRSSIARLKWHVRDSRNSDMKAPLRAIIEEFRPTAIVCHNLSGWSISAWEGASEAGVPVVQVLHDQYLRCPRGTALKSGRACQRQCLSCSALRLGHREASGKVAAVVGVSDYILRTFVTDGYFSQAEQVTIRNAQLVPDPGPPPSKPSGRQFRFGFLGSLVEAKGVEWLIDQFSSIGVASTLSIAGRGSIEYEGHLRALARDERISFAGYVDPKKFLGTIDALVVPSLWPDTFPGVAYEACAAHVPVLASDIGGLPEIISHEVNGLLFDPCEPTSLGAAMRLIAEDRYLHGRMSANARASVLPLLDPARMIDEYEVLLRSVHC